MKIRYGLSVLLVTLGLPALAEPLSAVDWLSKSLQTPQQVAPEQPLSGVLIEPIEITSLTDVQKDTVGIIPSQISGIPQDFWGNSRIERIAGFIRTAPLGQLPEITSLWRRIILAEIDPPIGAGQENILLLARLDNLLLAGALDPAEALLKAADPNNPQLFRRWFDVSILTQRAGNACARMVKTPNFAPTLQARIFCLARAGDWLAATVTLNTGRALGDFTDDEALLLGRFLDPVAYAQAPDPALPKVLTPLTFVMREALALPRPAQSLPLAFLHMDLQNNAGWKLRLTSAERLVKEAAIPPVALLDLYLEGKASASGGVWARVDAVQKLNTALGAVDDDRLSNALVNAYQALAIVGLQSVLSDWFAPALEGHKLNAQAKSIGFELAVLHADSHDLAISLGTSKQLENFITSILKGQFNAPAKGNLQQAVLNALSGLTTKTVLHQSVDMGRKGEAVLSALTLLHEGAATDVNDIEVALSVLIYSGFHDEAVRIATQLLFAAAP
ncbi:MAG: hypothetical protein JKX71_10670 [Amylibacter sp.]|nr:hypothetical protein [Amylibacter sp.]